MAGPTRVALVGYGYWGANLARNLTAAATTTLVGVADPDPGQRALAERSHPGIRTWADLDGALADDEVEAVVIATPATLHAEMALAALEAGRHVLVEKPLALAPGPAERVVSLAGERDLVVMVGHTFLYSPPVRYLRDVLREGGLGRAQYLYSQRLSLGKIRRDCNALWNFGPHDVSIMLYLLDERPTEVSSRSMNFIQDGVADVFFATLAFPSGVGAHLHVSWIDPRKTRLMTVVGDEKMAVYNDVSADQKIWIFDAGVARSPNPTLGEYESLGEFQWRTRAGDIVIPRIPMVEPLLLELEEFGKACAGEVVPLAGGRHGLEVVRILDAIDRSARCGGAPVRIEW
jgi:predicted dehydrogenase